MMTLALLPFLISPAFAANLAGVEIPESANVEGTSLTLNGAGIRSKFMFKIYVGSLYATKKTRSAVELLNSSDKKLVKLHFLRSVEKDKIIDAWKEGFERNCGTDCSAFRADLTKLTALTENMTKKDTLSFVLTPEKVGYLVNDRLTGQVDKPGFARLVLSIFIGDKPADAALKKGLLGD